LKLCQQKVFIGWQNKWKTSLFWAEEGKTDDKRGGNPLRPKMGEKGKSG